MADDGDDAGRTADADAVLHLPDPLRDALKQPMGPVETDTDSLLATAERPLIAVGDVVTHHLLEAGARPDLAVIDWHTEREALADAARPDLGEFERRIDVTNPAATLTAGLLDALAETLRADDSPATAVVVEGEEDLAVLPALVAAPEGASVVYGQPGAGMVHVAVTPSNREHARDLLGRMDGARDRAWNMLGVENPS